SIFIASNFTRVNRLPDIYYLFLFLFIRICTKNKRNVYQRESFQSEHWSSFYFSLSFIPLLRCSALSTIRAMAHEQVVLSLKPSETMVNLIKVYLLERELNFVSK